MQVICKKYTYNHVHDATLLQDIMKELAGVDWVRELKDTPAPGTGTAHSVADLVSYLSSMMDANTDMDYSESAYAATSNSELYKETRKPRGRERHMRENDESDWIQVKHKNSSKTKLTSPVTVSQSIMHMAYSLTPTTPYQMTRQYILTPHWCNRTQIYMNTAGNARSHGASISNECYAY